MPPARSWLIWSMSLPSWLFGNSFMVIRPPVAASMRSMASCMRVLIGLVGDWPVANLNSNSAALAGRVRMANIGKAAVAANRVRRLSDGSDVLVMVSLPGSLVSREPCWHLRFGIQARCMQCSVVQRAARGKRIDCTER